MGRYDSFGNCQVLIEEIENNLRFAGQYYDQETGLHYNLNRYYDPKLGRYLRTDPFGDGLNLYAYCFSNPNSLIDPQGLCAISSSIPYMRMIGDAISGRWIVSYLKQLVDQGTYNNWFTQGLAAGAFTVLSVAEGVLYAPESFAGQIKDFISEPSLSTLPGLGPLGVAIGESWAQASLDPSFSNYSRAVGNSLIGASTALGGAVALRGTAAAPNRVATPHGPAIQSTSAEARAALGQVKSGSAVYRQGNLGTQRTADAQYWSLQNPAATKGYANKMGMPSAGSGEPWIMKGTVKPSTQVITREAPRIGKNIGGDIEAVTQPGGVAIEWFHMP